MAILDAARDAFVVRIVYDGPAFSGKTTTLNSLSSGLSGKVQTPGEHDGRTLFFDWLDYTAGRFEGRPIRCQVVTVPGQRSLNDRRRKLLADADSVVFVADTGRLGMDLSLKYAQELGSVLAKLDEPRPGIVIQANKRDVDDAMSMPEIIEKFRGIGIEAAFIETTATSGVGVREAFLFGVRVALDRVRELSRRGLLKAGRPLVDSSEDLLAQLVDDEGTGLPAGAVKPNSAAGSISRPASPAADVTTKIPEGPGPAGDQPAAEAADRSSAAAGGEAEPAQPEDDSGSTLLRDVMAEAISAETAYDSEADTPPPLARKDAGDEHKLPDPMVPSGFIWPPVEGRVIMQQALAAPGTKLEILPEGDLFADSPNGWLFHSRMQDVFEDQNKGRSALVEWARLHARNRDYLSERRCVVLSPCPSGWRLWQLVGKVRSLGEFLDVNAGELSAREVAEHLLVAGRKLLAAHSGFQKVTVEFHIGLSSVAADSSRACFVDPMPGFDMEIDSEREPEDVAPFLRRHLKETVRQLAAQRSPTEVVAALESIGSRTQDAQPLIDILSNILTAQQAA